MNILYVKKMKIVSCPLHCCTQLYSYYIVSSYLTEFTGNETVKKIRQDKMYIFGFHS
jgi:hypothetical protein